MEGQTKGRPQSPRQPKPDGGRDLDPTECHQKSRGYCLGRGRQSFDRKWWVGGVTVRAVLTVH